MEVNSHHFLIIFQNTHSIMRAEKVCSKNSIVYQILPIPTHISSECGMCLEVDETDLGILKEKLRENNVKFTLAMKH